MGKWSSSRQVAVKFVFFTYILLLKTHFIFCLYFFIKKALLECQLTIEWLDLRDTLSSAESFNRFEDTNSSKSHGENFLHKTQEKVSPIRNLYGKVRCECRNCNRKHAELVLGPYEFPTFLHYLNGFVTNRYFSGVLISMRFPLH